MKGFITKKNAARIVHEYLRQELEEPDEIDGSPAYVLQDLFDCRVCAGHIMQVYVKGIMDEVILADGRMIFDADSRVSPEEMSDILTRVCFPEFRIPRMAEADGCGQTATPEELSLEQAMLLLQEKKNILLVDVRTEREYEKEYLNGAVNVPLLSIIKNPFMFSENRGKLILLYCKEGYQSKAAAQCLLEAGYKNVAYFAMEAVMFIKK